MTPIRFSGDVILNNENKNLFAGKHSWETNYCIYHVDHGLVVDELSAREVYILFGMMSNGGPQERVY